MQPKTRSASFSKKTWVLVILLGLALLFSIGWLSFQRQLAIYQKQFESSAESGFQIISQNFTSTAAVIETLVGLNLASDEMDPALFSPFNEKILQKYPYIESVQYLTYLSADEIEDFEQEMRESGFSQFRVYDLLSSNRDLKKEPYSLVTSFIEPLSPLNARFMGFNWIGSDIITNAVNKAVIDDTLVLIKSPEIFEASDHYFLLKPTYFGRTVSSSVLTRQKQLSGLFLLSIDWKSISNQISQQYPQSHQHNIKVMLETSMGIFSEESSDLIPQQFFSKAGRVKKHKNIDIDGFPIKVTISSELYLHENDYFSIVRTLLLTAIVYFLAIFFIHKRFVELLDKKKVQNQLYKERERAQVTLSSIGDAVITVDVDENINYLNPIAERLFDCRLDQVKGQTLSELVRLMDLSTGNIISDPLNYYLENTHSKIVPTGVDIALNINGSMHSVDGNASPMLDADNEVIGSVLVLRDVSLERQLTNELVYQASHDALTGLVNRIEFENKLKEALEKSRQQDTQYALCYLDMDQFKLVNDTCGHIAGDDLLKQVAGLLLVQMREGDLVARMGGDEFGVLISNCDYSKAQEIAERIKHCLNDFHFQWEGKIFDVSASIGLVMINRVSGNVDDILSSADLACYAAKDAGRNTVHTYHEDDEEISEKFTQMQWLPRIKEALLNDEFSLAIQPILPLSKGHKPSKIYEFLLRWPQADGGFISPAVFIPSAERYDLMRDIDKWVINMALKVLPELEKQADSTSHNMYTINLSGQSLGDAGLAEYILDKIDKYHVNPELICFEVTETVAIANFSLAIDFISQLRERGCRIALDDFGSGLSSFGYLKRLPLDFLKIDGLFVRDMMKDPVDMAMVRTIHDVAKVLKLKTIAEWVEDEDVYLALKDIGVNYAQGYYLDKPQMIDELLSKPDVKRYASSQSF